MAIETAEFGESGIRHTSARVTVIIVTYNSRSHLNDLLASFRAQTFQDFELLVVDSRSSDGTLDVVRQQWPAARTVASAENLGYRRGNQAGMERAQGEYLLVVNDDVELHPRMIECLVRTADESPAVAIVAPAILLYGYADRLNAAGSSVLPAGFYSARGKNRSFDEFQRRAEIAAASGCCFLLRAAAYRELGGFDSLFDTLPSGWHASVEDLDLCWRVWQAGYCVVYQPSAVLWHKYTQKPLSAERFTSLISGRLAFVALNYSRETLVRFLPALVTTEVALIIYSAARGPLFLRAWWAGWHWISRNRRRLKELRGLRQARLRGKEHAPHRFMQASIALAPSLQENPILRFVARVFFGFNALCLGWRR